MNVDTAPDEIPGTAQRVRERDNLEKDKRASSEARINRQVAEGRIKLNNKGFMFDKKG